ncbi:hypothetical protein GCM10010954_25930 [Halobacillus andaensis]|uniref:GGDEF domain-containing protein n=1 Tax=Halobacillus andaensis TaxID=1176239 RepID=A0A917EXC1_HALAA|nr:diguanylate cyclase [Halobacillus andaensis]MBP2005821.1 diguanylate cyclase [Halobacillus andaensis]GGF25803.1 hypothetical protein GCM10010954_25930 [Halobacillus andaensis]
MVHIDEFILNASILITIIYLSAFLHKHFLVRTHVQFKAAIFVIISIAAGWVSMFFGIHLSQSVIFDLRFIPIIIVALYAKNPFQILMVGGGIGLLRFTFGMSEAALIGFINMLVLSITGMILSKQFKYRNFTRKIFIVSILLNTVNVVVIATLGVLSPGEYFRLVVPTAFPMSIALSLFLAWMVKDLAEEFRYKKDLMEKASRDPLTKLYNRRAFMRFYDQHAKDRNSALSVAFIDIDYFKEVNDTHGHVTGDLVLQKLSKLLSQNLRTIDIIARYGGEEFIVLLPHCNQWNAEKAMERIREAIEREVFHVNGLHLQLTISTGIATTDDVEASQLILAADEALYTAKNNGRNRVECYKSGKTRERFTKKILVHSQNYSSGGTETIKK